MKQLIAEPTHVLENSSNLIMDFGVHCSLHSKCHHVIHVKLNLQREYPPPYTREVQDYGEVQFDLINKAIENFDWNELFSGPDIHNQVNLFNTFILCDDKETPWVNDEVRLLI